MENKKFCVKDVTEVIKELGLEDWVDAEEMTCRLNVFVNERGWKEYQLPNNCQFVPALPNTILFDNNGTLYRVVQYAVFVKNGDVVSCPIGEVYCGEGIFVFNYTRYYEQYDGRSLFTGFIGRSEAALFCILPILCGNPVPNSDFYSFSKMLELYGVSIVPDDMRMF